MSSTPGYYSNDYTETMTADDRHAARHILLLEADEGTRRLVSAALGGNGYDLRMARDGQQALNDIDCRGLPHLAIVGLHPAGMGGRRFCQIVRAYADVPLVLITTANEVRALPRGLRPFADYVLARPFTERQIAARVAHLLRSYGDSAYTLAPRITIDDRLEVDLAHQSAYVSGNEVRLTPLENKVLFVLMRAAPQLVSYSTLIERVWGKGGATEDVVRVHVHRLRHKLGGDAGRISYVHTASGLGYRFHPDARIAPQPAMQPSRA
ncbi:MAG: response regulator transcription factor [Anaerolineales bacterium]|nr:response regulator transcription factor [Anaerolineales bacterium]